MKSFMITFTFLFVFPTPSFAENCKGDLASSSMRFSKVRQHPLIDDMVGQIDDATYFIKATSGKFAVYDYRSQTILRELPIRYDRRYTSAIISDDGKVAISTGLDEIEIIDIDAGVVRKTIPFATTRPHSGPDVRYGWNSLHITKDRKRAFLSGLNSELVVLDLVKDRIAWVPAPKELFPRGVSFVESPDGRYVLANGMSGNKILFDRNSDTGSEILGRNDLNGAQFALDSKSIILRSQMGKLVRYDIENKTFSNISDTQYSSDQRLDLTPDGKMLIVMNDLPFTLVDLATMQEVPVDFPSRDYKSYFGYKVSRTQNAITATNFANFWMLDLATLSVSEFILPSELKYHLYTGDISLDGRSYFIRLGGRDSKVFEVY